MSSPINAIYNGAFTSDATPSAVTLSLPAAATEIEITDVTGYILHSAAVTRASGRSALPGCADVWTGSGASPNVMTLTQKVAAGFTFFDDSGLVANSAATALNGAFITRAAVALAATGDTTTVPLAAGDVIRMYGSTGMLQIAGMDFTVGTVIANTSFTMAYLNNSGFAADSTAGQWRKLPFRGVTLALGGIAPDPRFYPRNRYITAITAGATTLVQLSVAHSYQVGEKVRLIVPQEFGMVEINGSLGTITAINYTTNTITLDINSTGFTAFAFPTSAIAAGGITFAQCIPVGEAAINTIALPVGNRLDDRTRNTSIKGVVIDSSLLVASHAYSWIAKKGLTI